MYLWCVFRSCVSQVAGITVCVIDWQEERLRRGDDLRLQMAIEESKREKLKPEEVCVKLIYFSLSWHYLHELSPSLFSQFYVHVDLSIV